ncbi:hypothetical protein JTB14_009257 [Gonioctena quinquepunctata]|nr:hypothetical protein JTB14_009257 [Gonioctena quinquepunctata]
MESMLLFKLRQNVDLLFLITKAVTVLLAVCNANYQFTMLDFGGEGRHSDGGIYRNSAIGTLMLSGGLHLPAPLDQYCQELGNIIIRS